LVVLFIARGVNCKMMIERVRRCFAKGHQLESTFSDMGMGFQHGYFLWTKR